MSSQKHIIRVQHCVTKDGKKYCGTRILEGQRIIYQTIEYNGRLKSDGKGWSPSDKKSMDLYADLLLHELIAEHERKSENGFA